MEAYASENPETSTRSSNPLTFDQDELVTKLEGAKAKRDFTDKRRQHYNEGEMLRQMKA
jgi:hypothetical protein